MIYRLTPTQKIVFTGLFAALAVVFKMIKISLYVVNISFFYIPCFISGIVLGPLYALGVGLTGEILGPIFAGNTPAPLIAVSGALLGFIMGLVCNVKSIKNIYIKIVTGAFLCLIIVTLGINAYALTIPPALIYPDYQTALSVRIVGQTPMVAINTGLTLIIYAMLNDTILKKYAVPYKTNVKEQLAENDTFNKSKNDICDDETPHKAENTDNDGNLV